MTRFFGLFFFYFSVKLVGKAGELLDRKLFASDRWGKTARNDDLGYFLFGKLSENGGQGIWKRFSALLEGGADRAEEGLFVDRIVGLLAVELDAHDRGIYLGRGDEVVRRDGEELLGLTVVVKHRGDSSAVLVAGG